MKIKDKVLKGNDVMKDAKGTYLFALKSYNSIIAPIVVSQEKILNTLLKAVNCERHSWDCPKYTDAHFTNEGVTMCIDADHPNDRIISKLSWGDVDAVYDSYSSDLNSPELNTKLMSNY